MKHEDGLFTQKIDTIELLVNCIQESETRATSLVNQIENLLYVQSRHVSVTPGNIASYAVHRGSSRGGGA